MNPKLTDEALADLPLHAGRAELLEEIMSTPVSDPVSDPVTSERDLSPRRARWLVPLAAAATVAAVATAPLWWGGPDGSSGTSPSSQGQAKPAVEGQGNRAVLDAPGWQVDQVEDQPPYGSVGYSKGRAWLEITWYGADSYADYVVDREHIVSPPAPGEPVEVLGRPAQLWAYSADDHTVIREVEAGHWMEIRGLGLDRPDYLALLQQLRLVTLEEFAAALPDSVIVGAERPAAVDAILQGIEGVAGVRFPAGAAPELRTGELVDPYHLGADVAGAVACAWITEFKDATSADDQQRMTEAARVLGTARQWPVLLEMDERGDYSEVIWDTAAEVAAGQVPKGYAQGLGCGD